MVAFITLVGVTAIFVTIYNMSSSYTDISTDVVDVVGSKNIMPTQISTPTPTSIPTLTPTPQITVTPTLKKIKPFVMPVSGKISFDYSEDKLLYSKTLGEWRTHSGIDIASDLGIAVKAVNDGIVCEIKNDPRFGITVTVNHDSGIKTVYSNLASSNMVKIGQKIMQSDVVGAIGNTASIEALEESHLHFEVLKDNQNIDPKQYLPMLY